MSVSEITETRQYLTFKLGHEVFGIDVAKVREVLDFTDITEIPRTPEFMSGVINLRGSVVPVVDLHKLTGAGECPSTSPACAPPTAHTSSTPSSAAAAKMVGCGNPPKSACGGLAITSESTSAVWAGTTFITTLDG